MQITSLWGSTEKHWLCSRSVAILQRIVFEKEGTREEGVWRFNTTVSWWNKMAYKLIQ